MASSAKTCLYGPKVQSSRLQCVAVAHPAPFSPKLASQRAGNHINHTFTSQFNRIGTALTTKRSHLLARLMNQQIAPEAARRLHLIPHSLLPSTSFSSTSDENTSPNDDITSSSGSESPNTEAKIDLNLPRRSRLIAFTCNFCNGRSERLVNPVAWEKGLVIVQCQHCKKWHKVADAANLVEEIRYADLEE